MYSVLDVATAPPAARAQLETAQRKFGFLPNLLGVLAHAPAALRAYLAVSDAVGGTRLTAVEQQIVAIAVSAENGCGYCVAAHSTMAAMAGTPSAELEAVRGRSALANPRLEALRALAAAIVRTRGRPDPAVLEAFVAAGYDHAQVLDVIAIVAMKTLSNYVNHLADTPVDAAFAAQQWEQDAAV